MIKRDVVISSYPMAICKKITYPRGAYFLIYDDINSKIPKLLGYDMESENNAWIQASNILEKEMLRVLEK
jgi:CHASE1-domain containing sensor protein